MEQLISDLILPAGMLCIMCGMGLALSIDDFRRVASKPVASTLGTLLQLVAMPLVGIALAAAYELPPLLAAGLVIAAACPGGMFSNVYVHLARANTALSVTLTASATLVTLFTLPLWVQGGLRFIGGPDASIDMPVFDTALRLGGLTILPVAVGMLLRARGVAGATTERWLTRFGVLAIACGFTADAMLRPELPVEEFNASVQPAIALCLGGLVLGTLSPWLLRLPSRDAVTIAVELVVKNGLLGIVLARNSLDLEAAIPIFVFGMFQTPIGIALLVSWRWRAKRRGEST